MNKRAQSEYFGVGAVSSKTEPLNKATVETQGHTVEAPYSSSAVSEVPSHEVVAIAATSAIQADSTDRRVTGQESFDQLKESRSEVVSVRIAADPEMGHAEPPVVVEKGPRSEVHPDSLANSSAPRVAEEK